MHRLTTLSKGTGFVKFEEQKDADALLAKYEKIATAFQNVGEKKKEKKEEEDDEESEKEEKEEKEVSTEQQLQEVREKVAVGMDGGREA